MKILKNIPLKSKDTPSILPLLKIDGVELLNHLENSGLFLIGSSGSLKSQPTKNIIETIRKREDYRLVVFDYAGELLQEFYQEVDCLFQPKDSRSVNWSHSAEVGLESTIAQAIIDSSKDEEFFRRVAIAILTELYKRCENNKTFRQALFSFSDLELLNFLQGFEFANFLRSEHIGASILALLRSSARFYHNLPDCSDNFSFSKWAKEDDRRSLFIPLFPEDAEVYNPLYCMIFELVAQGLLSNSERKIQTVVIIDGLDALPYLPSLGALLNQGRGKQVGSVITTQELSSIQEKYGEPGISVLLGASATKLILNCGDSQTAQLMSDLMGNYQSEKSTASSVCSERAILATEIRSLLPLSGYLLLDEEIPIVKVSLDSQGIDTFAVNNTSLSA